MRPRLLPGLVIAIMVACHWLSAASGAGLGHRPTGQARRAAGGVWLADTQAPTSARPRRRGARWPAGPGRSTSPWCHPARHLL